MASLGSAFEGALVAAKAGSSWAFERLYNDLAAPVHAYLRLQGSTEPDDVTSEVFLSVFSNLSSFTGDESRFRSWVFTIAHRRMIDERRRRSRRPVLLLPSEEIADQADGDVQDDAFAVLGTRRVYELCDRLSPDQKQVILLRVVADLTVGQVAVILGRSPGAVKALQRRALEALKKMIEADPYPSEPLQRLRR